ncbi:MAG: STAS domain-containing protein, partial [Chloroflexota bacterium]
THFQKIFRMTGLTQYADLYHSVEETLRSIDKKTTVRVLFTRHSATTIEVEGDLTISAGQALTQAYQTATTRGVTKIIFDFRKSHYINSTGIAILIGMITVAREHGQRILFTGLNAHFQKIFDMVGLSQYADIFPSVEEALNISNTTSPILERETPDSDEQAQVNVSLAGNIAVIELTGDLTISVEKALNEAYQTVTDEGVTTIIFDFQEHNRVHGASIAALIVILNEASKRSQRVLIAGLAPQLQEMFRQIDVPDLYPSIREAQESVGKVQTNE